MYMTTQFQKSKINMEKIVRKSWQFYHYEFNIYLLNDKQLLLIDDKGKEIYT